MYEMQEAHLFFKACTASRCPPCLLLRITFPGWSCRDVQLSTNLHVVIGATTLLPLAFMAYI